MDPVAAARGLRELILSNRQTTEAERKLAAPVVAALIETQLCRVALPRIAGGLETPPVQALEIFEELAAAEASVAWVAWNNSLVCWFARHLEPAVRERIFGDPDALFANSTRPSGRAVAENGGYRVSGRWSLVSGCMHARWIPVLCLVEKDGQIEMLESGTPHLRMVFVPKDKYQILDTWHTGGLRGTGSHDVVLDDELVPAELSFVPFAGPSYVESNFCRTPIVVVMASGCASICLGIARSAVEELIALGRTRLSPEPEPDLRDRPATQSMVARASTLLSALRTHLHSSLGNLLSGLERDGGVTPEALAEAWGAAIMTALECRSMLSEIYATAGTASLYTDNPIERAHRDIHAVLQHVVVQPFWLEQAGRVKLGLAPTNPLFAV
jgi:alkylation response protein AidB-like acyl-CoA dehydrogenase